MTPSWRVDTTAPPPARYSPSPNSTAPRDPGGGGGRAAGAGGSSWSGRGAWLGGLCLSPAAHACKELIGVAPGGGRWGDVSKYLTEFGAHETSPPTDGTMGSAHVCPPLPR